MLPAKKNRCEDTFVLLRDGTRDVLPRTAIFAPPNYRRSLWQADLHIFSPLKHLHFQVQNGETRGFFLDFTPPPNPKGNPLNH